MTTHYTTPTAAGLYRKKIVYDRDTHDYAMYLDGELVGFARTYHDAECTLDTLVFEQMSGEAGPGTGPHEINLTALRIAVDQLPGVAAMAALVAGAYACCEVA